MTPEQFQKADLSRCCMEPFRQKINLGPTQKIKEKNRILANALSLSIIIFFNESEKQNFNIKTIITPHSSYGILIWGQAKLSNIRPI